MNNFDDLNVELRVSGRSLSNLKHKLETEVAYFELSVHTESMKVYFESIAPPGPPASEVKLLDAVPNTTPILRSAVEVRKHVANVKLR